jgi:hypothetical protein
MTKYFKSDIKKAFLQYFITFGVSHRFCEHTGCFCTVRYLKRMRKRFRQLKMAYNKAREDLDFEMVAKIEMGYFFRKRR